MRSCFNICIFNDSSLNSMHKQNTFAKQANQKSKAQWLQACATEFCCVKLEVFTIKQFLLKLGIFCSLKVSRYCIKKSKLRGKKWNKTVNFQSESLSTFYSCSFQRLIKIPDTSKTLAWAESNSLSTWLDMRSRLPNCGFFPQTFLGSRL